MVSYGLSHPPGKILALPTRTEIRDMINNSPAVFVSVIVAATLVVLGFLGALTFLAYTGRSAETLTVALVAPLIGLLVSIASRTKATAERINQVYPPADGGER